MSWPRKICLGDAIRVKHGFAFKGQYFSDSGEYIILTPGNFNEEGGFRLRPGKDRFYIGDIPEDYILDEGDLLIAMTEQGVGLLGSSALIPEGGKYLHNQRLGLIQDIDQSVLDKKFLYYLFNTKQVRGQISGSATGTKVKHTAPERIYRVKVSIPADVAEQRRIGAILSAYDDLIENNRRRIALLEQAARLLYKEWFVHLRFPGHEHVRVMDGVPEGWKRVQVKDVLEKLNRPKKIKQSEYLPEGPIPCVDQSRDFIGGYTYDEDAVIDIGRSVIVFGDHTRILKYVDFPFACGADGTQLIISNDPAVSQEFLYFALDAIDLTNYFYARHFKFLKDQFIPRPNEAILSQFTDIVRPTLNQIKLLRAHCERLAKARDMLLPRLMNEEIVV